VVPYSAGTLTTPKGHTTYDSPKEMTLMDIKETVGEFQNAARLAREAGFDGVQIHGANGYLVDQFLQGHTNLRTDDYGGSFKNRYRFLKEVLLAVKREWPADKIGIKINPNGAFGGMGHPDFREMFMYTFEQLAKENLAFIHLVDGLAFGFHGHGKSITAEEVMEVLVKAQGKDTRKTKLVANCGYTFETAEKVVEAGHADMVAFGRFFMTNPDLVEKYASKTPLTPIHDTHFWWYGGVGATGYTEKYDAVPPAK
jgi:N-ethylmaleimide reductase